MTLLFRIITAAYASGTHHRLALDGVQRLDGPDGAAWQRLFLKHADLLVKGSKAPDDQFKDFKNHVLHPRDNFWGGAPDKARSWYVDLVETLKKGDWPAAVWCAGVLSHYVTDPINPFHTAQSEAENAIHRAFEWSISRSYDDLKRIAAADAARTINIAEGSDWLEQLICQAATEANVHYEKLIAHYDIHRGVVDPPSGLDSIAQKIVGELIGLASAVFAAVLRRAILEANATAPEVNLTLDMVLASLKIPVAKLMRKLADREERKVVERIYDELKATGTVEKSLPEDDRVVRDLHAIEVLGNRAAPDLKGRFPEKGRRKTAETEGEKSERLKRVGTRGIPSPGRSAVPPVPDKTVRELPVEEPARPAPKAADQSVPGVPVGRFRGEKIEKQPAPAAEVAPDVVAAPAASAMEPQPPLTETAPAAAPVAPTAPLSASMAALMATSVPSFPRPSPRLAAAIEKIAEPEVRPESSARIFGFASRTAPPSGAKIYLTAAQPIVDAPSIGPKMAERLIPLGLNTVGDLLAAQPGNVAARLAMSSIDADTILDWQDQARLVCAVPGLRGTHAQLLVGAGFRSVDAIAEADAEQVCAKVLAFAASRDGQRILRDGNPPDIERIKSWTDNARAVRAA